MSIRRLVHTLRSRWAERSRPPDVRLVGGSPSHETAIAHDLRNLLMVIDGAAVRTLELLADDHSVRADLLEVRRSATRATVATKGLLGPNPRAALAIRIVTTSSRHLGTCCRWVAFG